MSAQTSRAANDLNAPNDLEAWWLPFTANRSFKQRPRMISRAKGMYYYTPEGREVIDGAAGLWCCNAGHNRDEITQAIQAQAQELDYSPAFQFGHAGGFALASRLAQLAPGDLNHVFFCNSGSEAVDTALKVALAYWNVKGQGSKTRLIGRERGYHGVGFGGISVGGIVTNRRFFGSLLAGVDHLPHTYNRAEQAFSRGEPEWGAHLADELERIVTLHDASTVAAVIVEPMAGSTGVIAAPKGYLKRLREICDKHGILLIFDEVITGFGRLGAGFATDYFGVMPDIVCTAKGITNGTIPMGGVFVRKHIYDAFMTGPEGAIELFHGYTYSGHPVACAAALATLDTYQEDGLFQRAADLAPYWEDAVHSLKDARHVIDLRNLGLIAGIELEPLPGQPTKRAFEAFLKCFEAGVMIRTTGDIIALSPPLIIDKAEIDRIFTTIRDVLATIE
jgi:beta-alanine--pyruvate transaminase